MRGRFVAVERAWLRVHPLTTGGVRRPETEPFHADRDPPVSPDEEALFSAIGEELGRLGRERP
ncbi:MAG TPA: hypothetical protein VNO21_03335, partial [Polyangiaceae bacterium]|nr:hypothetical protein [Polyangiaceae bacterium]